MTTTLLLRVVTEPRSNVSTTRQLHTHTVGLCPPPDDLPWLRFQPDFDRILPYKSARRSKPDRPLDAKTKTARSTARSSCVCNGLKNNAFHMPPPGPLDGHFCKGRGADNAAGAAATFNRKRSRNQQGGTGGRDDVARQRLAIKRLERLIAAQESALKGQPTGNKAPLSYLQLIQEAGSACLAIDMDSKGMALYTKCIKAGAPGDPLGVGSEMVAVHAACGNWKAADEVLHICFGDDSQGCLALFTVALRELVMLRELCSRLGHAAGGASTAKADAALTLAVASNPHVAVMLASGLWGDCFGPLVELVVRSAGAQAGAPEGDEEGCPVAIGGVEEAALYLADQSAAWSAHCIGPYSVRELLAQFLVKPAGSALLRTAVDSGLYRSGASEPMAAAYEAGLAALALRWPWGGRHCGSGTIPALRRLLRHCHRRRQRQGSKKGKRRATRTSGH